MGAAAFHKPGGMRIGLVTVRRIGILDPVVAGMVLAGGLVAWFHGGSAEGAKASVYVDGRRVAWWKLVGEVRRDTVVGALGPVVVAHGGGSVAIVSAPCPHQLCVRAGSTRRVHSQVACVPSRVVVVVEGDDPDGLDAVQ